MKGSITISKPLNGNTTEYLTIKYYDSWLDQNADLQILVEAFEKMGLQVSYKTYTKNDYNATYITLKLKQGEHLPLKPTKASPKSCCKRVMERGAKMLQVVFKTKNTYCLEKARRTIASMSRAFGKTINMTHNPLSPDDSTRGILVSINGLIDAQVIIGGVDGSYIHMWWMENGENKFFQLDLAELQRIISL